MADSERGEEGEHDEEGDDVEQVSIQKPRRRNLGWTALLGAVTREREDLEKSRARLAVAAEAVSEIHKGNLVVRSATNHRENALRNRKRELRASEKSVRRAMRQAERAVRPGPFGLVMKRLWVAVLWLVIFAIVAAAALLAIAVLGWVMSWLLRFGDRLLW